MLYFVLCRHDNNIKQTTKSTTQPLEHSTRWRTKISNRLEREHKYYQTALTNSNWWQLLRFSNDNVQKASIDYIMIAYYFNCRTCTEMPSVHAMDRRKGNKYPQLRKQQRLQQVARQTRTQLCNLELCMHYNTTTTQTVRSFYVGGHLRFNTPPHSACLIMTRSVVAGSTVCLLAMLSLVGVQWTPSGTSSSCSSRTVSKIATLKCSTRNCWSIHKRQSCATNRKWQASRCRTYFTRQAYRSQWITKPSARFHWPELVRLQNFSVVHDLRLVRRQQVKRTAGRVKVLPL